MCMQRYDTAIRAKMTARQGNLAGQLLSVLPLRQNLATLPVLHAASVTNVNVFARGLVDANNGAAAPKSRHAHRIGFACFELISLSIS